MLTANVTYLSFARKTCPIYATASYTDTITNTLPLWIFTIMDISIIKDAGDTLQKVSSTQCIILNLRKLKEDTTVFCKN